MTVIEQWWRVKKPGGGGTVWCPTDPTEQIATGQAPAWEGSTVDGPFVLASTTQGAVNLLRQARGYVADHAAAHPGDELAARLWSEIDAAITAGGQSDG